MIYRRQRDELVFTFVVGDYWSSISVLCFCVNYGMVLKGAIWENGLKDFEGLYYMVVLLS